MLNKEFLKKLDKQENKIIYVRITSLSIDDLPLEIIEGKVTSGSISIDGDSAVRRSCQIGMVANPTIFTKYFWTLKTRFKLEIGVDNFVDGRYPSRIWFNQGIYVITQFSAQVSTTGYSINLSGQDKMCLLNGTIGGSLESSVNFGIMEQEDADGNIRYIHQPLKDIVLEAVHHYGGEPFHNIVINDLEETGLILQEYRYDIPLYLIRNAAPPGNEEYYQGTLDGQKECHLLNSDKPIVPISELPSYDSLTDTIDAQDEAITVSLNPFTPERNEVTGELEIPRAERRKIAKISYGQTAGYIETDLTYNGELIAKAGETITSILDKIKTMLGNYEYFYNIDGQFVFQKKKNFIKTNWSPSGEYMENLIEANESVYEFNENNFIISLSSAPTINNIKNDFAVWGETDAKTPIHLRYALQKKPTKYQTFEVLDKEFEQFNKKNNLVAVGQESVYYFADKNAYNDYNGSAKKVLCDWREVLYQMASDYSRFNHFDDYAIRLKEFNKQYANGTTGYEYFYPDILGFWRSCLYNMSQEPIYEVINSPIKGEKYFIMKNYPGYEPLSEELKKTVLIGESKGVKVYQRQEDETYKRVVYPFAEKAELYIFHPQYEKMEKEYNPEDFTEDNPDKNIYYQIVESEFYPAGEAHEFWHKNVYESPSSLIFWFDFLEGVQDLSINEIGHRPKVDNDTGIRALYYPNTPNIIFKAKPLDEGENQKTGYRYFDVTQQGLERMFTTSAQGKSAKDKLDELLYNHLTSAEALNITSLPIFWLEPNHRITVKDSETGINGDFIVSRLSFQLSYNTTMSLTTTKAIDYII